MSSCCLVDHDYDGDECFESYTEKEVTAKATMTCAECDRKIPIWTKHWLFVGIDGDKRTHFRTCPRCMELRKRFCCSFVFGSILDDIYEELKEIDGEIELGALDGLSVEAVEWISDVLEEI